MTTGIKRSIFHHLHQIKQLMRRLDEEKSDLGQLTMHQLQALFYIKKHGQVKMHELAETLRISAGSATLLADRLIESGWLVRQADAADRRIVHLTLSAQAKRHLEEIYTRRMQRMNTLLDKMPAETLEDLDRVLATLQTVLDDEAA